MSAGDAHHWSLRSDTIDDFLAGCLPARHRPFDHHYRRIQILFAAKIHTSARGLIGFVTSHPSPSERPAILRLLAILAGGADPAVPACSCTLQLLWSSALRIGTGKLRDPDGTGDAAMLLC